MQHRIAPGIPSGRRPVQITPPALEEAVVNRVADQGVREQKAILLRPKQEVRHQPGAVVVGLADQMPQRR